MDRHTRKFSIIAVASVDNDVNVRKQIAKQTIQPDEVYIYTDTEPAQTIELRRKRIARNQRLLQSVVRAKEHQLVWQVESDVELAENALEELLNGYLFLKSNNFGFISGIQVGRHGLYHLGAWRFNEKSFYSLDPNLKGLQQVDATGWYCMLTTKDVFISGRPEWTNEPYGPDVVWGLSIKKDKYVDMNIHVGHIVKNGIIRPSDMSTCQVKFYKEGDKWKFKTV